MLDASWGRLEKSVSPPSLVRSTMFSTWESLPGAESCTAWLAVARLRRQVDASTFRHTAARVCEIGIELPVALRRSATSLMEALGAQSVVLDMFSQYFAPRCQEHLPCQSLPPPQGLRNRHSCNWWVVTDDKISALTWMYFMRSCPLLTPFDDLAYRICAVAVGTDTPQPLSKIHAGGLSSSSIWYPESGGPTCSPLR